MRQRPGTPKKPVLRCPWCHKPAVETRPILGDNGVDIAYLHVDGDNGWWHFDEDVVACEDMEEAIDMDAECLYEIAVE